MTRIAFSSSSSSSSLKSGALLQVSGQSFCCSGREKAMVLASALLVPLRPCFARPCCAYTAASRRGAAAVASALSGQRRRPFFASSTDHTRLLEEAEVHCLDRDGGVKEYVMAAGGMDADSVRKVPQLHLARLSLKDKTLFGARVVNKTLGTRDEVCGKLVDAALKDAGSGATARSNLHGLSEWVLRGLRNEVSVKSLAELNEEEIDAVTSIAEGSASSDDALYEKGRQAWEKLASEFVEQRVGDEAALYQDKGAVFVSVEHHADDTDYADTSGGAMALLSFK